MQAVKKVTVAVGGEKAVLQAACVEPLHGWRKDYSETRVLEGRLKLSMS